MGEYYRGRHGLCTGAALIGALVAAAPVWAAAPVTSKFMPPPLSFPKAQALRAHPGQEAAFIAALRQRRAATPDTPRFTRKLGGTWAEVTALSSSVGLSGPVLLTDGTVIAQDADAPDWWKLTPDSSGNYADGTWTQIASLPVIGGVQYSPLYKSTAVLPDGRVIIAGGEYNGAQNGGNGVWTNLAAIYDPVANAWTAVTAPAGSAWSMIGDAQSIVLPNGTYMQATCCGDPDANALLDPVALTWTQTGAPTGDGTPYQDEQGYELLPNGNVLTIDVWAGYNTQTDPTSSETYNPTTAVWSAVGNTPVSLVDPYACGNFEIGPAALRLDGTLVAFGGNTGCVAGATADPTAIFNSKTGNWTAGPNVPSTCGTTKNESCTLADAPAAVLPNGNILFAASAGYGVPPAHFFLFKTKNTIVQVSDPLNKSGKNNSSYSYNFLVLPNGQVLMTDFSNVAQVYTPQNTKPLAGAAPVISSVPSAITRGTSYPISGTQFGGLTQGAYYGDDAQMATNYPIVRVTNTATGHVFYGRTSGITSFSVAPKAPGSANFVLPAAAETGASKLVVIANGIASAARSVTVN
jgi:hypothetical protein